MPFLETCAMEEWVRTLSEYERGHRRVSELCERNGKSRDIFYVWLERRWSGGAGWFRDRSQSRRSCPHSMLVGLEAAIVELAAAISALWSARGSAAAEACAMAVVARSAGEHRRCRGRSRDDFGEGIFSRRALLRRFGLVMFCCWLARLSAAAPTGP